jgi:hypothetical protein
MQDRPRVLLENLTPRRKQNPFPTPLKESHPKIHFQIPHLLRNTRLRNSEPVSRSAEASCLGDRKKVAETANVQGFRHVEKEYCSASSPNATSSLTSVLFKIDCRQDLASIGKTY